jgi:hypothetical protein
MTRSYHITEAFFVKARRFSQRRLRGRLIAALYLVLAAFPPAVGL